MCVHYIICLWLWLCPCLCKLRQIRIFFWISFCCVSLYFFRGGIALTILYWFQFTREFFFGWLLYVFLLFLISFFFYFSRRRLRVPHVRLLCVCVCVCVCVSVKYEKIEISGWFAVFLPTSLEFSRRGHRVPSQRLAGWVCAFDSQVLLILFSFFF